MVRSGRDDVAPALVIEASPDRVLDRVDISAPPCRFHAMAHEAVHRRSNRACFH